MTDRRHDVVHELRHWLDADDPRTIAELKADDDWQEGTITRADRGSTGWSIEWTEAGESGGKLGCGIGDDRNPNGLEPKVGDTIRFYGRGFGSPFHGIDLNGVEVFWRTPYERVADRVEWLANHDREQRERFVKQQADLDAKYEALPAPLKARIARFRSQRADFRIDSEAYEMAAVWDAPKIARAIAEREGWKLDDNLRVVPIDDDAPRPEQREVIAECVKRFCDISYDEQQKAVPDLDPGHSGNTFGGAVSLARALLMGEQV